MFFKDRIHHGAASVPAEPQGLRKAAMNSMPNASASELLAWPASRSDAATLPPC
jgi:hypothetical protein